MGVLKLLVAVTLITVSTTVILPYSLRLVFGDQLPANLPLIIVIALVGPVAGFAGVEMWKDVKQNRKIRREREKMDAIEQQTYKCIRPQVLDSYVVFPVTVNKRGCKTSSWMEISDHAVVVNLAAAVKITGASDTEGPLRRLCEATFKNDLQTFIYCGGGKAGPTGLSVGVGKPDFGPYLASNVAQSIYEAMRVGTTTQ